MRVLSQQKYSISKVVEEVVVAYALGLHSVQSIGNLKQMLVIQFMDLT